MRSLLLRNIVKFNFNTSLKFHAKTDSLPYRTLIDVQSSLYKVCIYFVWNNSHEGNTQYFKENHVQMKKLVDELNLNVENIVNGNDSHCLRIMKNIFVFLKVEKWIRNHATDIQVKINYWPEIESRIYWILSKHFAFPV